MPWSPERTFRLSLARAKGCSWLYLMWGGLGVRTTIGNKVFGALKGALDGGVDVSHSEEGVGVNVNVLRQ